MEDTVTEHAVAPQVSEPPLQTATPGEAAPTYIGKDTLVTINSETCTLKEWADKTGINMSTLSFRILHKWSDDRILSKPAPTGRALLGKQRAKKKKLTAAPKAKSKPGPKVKPKTAAASVPPSTARGITEHGDVVLIDMTVFEVATTKSELMILVRKDRLHKKH